MTAQQPDRLVVDGEEWLLLDTPLVEWLQARGFGSIPTTTANWRGHVATWRIDDGQLVLTGATGTVVRHEVHRGLTGAVRLPAGETSTDLIGCEGFALEPAAGDGERLDRFAAGTWLSDPDGAVVVHVADDALAERIDAGDLAALTVGPVDLDVRRAVRGRVVPFPLRRFGWIHVRDGATPSGWGWEEAAPAGADGSGPAPLRAWRRVAVDVGGTADGTWWRAEDVEVTLRHDPEALELDALFGTPPPVPADWVSGLLRIARGGVAEYVHMGFESRFEQERFLLVEAGRVVRTVDHTP